MSKDEILAIFSDSTLINKKQASFMYDHLIDLPKKGTIVDVGTGMGDAALLFALTKPDWVIYTIDGYGMYGTIDNVWNKAGNNSFNPLAIPLIRHKWEQRGAKNIIQIVADSTNIPWEIEADFIYIDADHSYEGVKKDAEKFLPFVKKGGMVAFHDYNDTYSVKNFIDNNLLDKWDIEVEEWSCVLRRKNGI